MGSSQGEATAVVCGQEMRCVYALGEKYRTSIGLRWIDKRDSKLVSIALRRKRSRFRGNARPGPGQASCKL